MMEVITKNTFDPEVIKSIHKDLLTFKGMDFSVRNDSLLVLPLGEYEKYKHNHYKDGDLTLELFSDFPAGLVLDIEYKNFNIIPGTAVYYPPMVGYKIHLNKDIDIHMKVILQTDILILLAPSQ